jgi:hypothetical protein
LNQHDDIAVWRELDGSVAGRVITWVAGFVSDRSRDSVTVTRCGDMAMWWRDAPNRARWLAVGVVAVAAAGSHVSLQLLEQPPGLWWLIVPGLVAVFGAAVIALGITRSE